MEHFALACVNNAPCKEHVPFTPLLFSKPPLAAHHDHIRCVQQHFRQSIDAFEYLQVGRYTLYLSEYISRVRSNV
jgi:hypothetical protein